MAPAKRKVGDDTNDDTKPKPKKPKPASKKKPAAKAPTVKNAVAKAPPVRPKPQSQAPAAKTKSVPKSLEAQPEDISLDGNVVGFSCLLVRHILSVLCTFFTVHEPRRSGRENKGEGGRGVQLAKLSSAIEKKPAKPKKTVQDIPPTQPNNPMAPSKSKLTRTRGKQKAVEPTEVAPAAGVGETANVALQYLVPPGTEPRLVLGPELGAYGHQFGFRPPAPAQTSTRPPVPTSTRPPRPPIIGSSSQVPCT